MFFVIYYLLGIGGVVRMLWQTFFPEADFFRLLCMTAGISVVFAACHLLILLAYRRWKRSKLLLLCVPAFLVLAGRALFVLSNRDGEMLPELREGFGRLYQSVMAASWNHFYPAGPVSRADLIWDWQTYLAFGIGLTVFGILLYLASVKTSRIGVLLVLIPPLAAVLAVGATPSFGAISLMALCCVGIFAGNQKEQTRREDWCRKEEVPRTGKFQLPMYAVRALAATAVSLVLLLISQGLASSWDSRVEERKLEARQMVRDTFTFMDFPESSVLALPDVPGLTSDPGELSNEDEIRYTGEVVAVLETDEQPEGTLYLKNYNGSQYTGHGWERQDEDMEPDSYLAAVWFEDAPGLPSYQELSVQLSDSLSGDYVPYFSMTSGTAGDETDYQCFWPENYMRLVGQNEFQVWMAQLQAEAGMESGESIRTEAYLGWPDTLSRLKQICDENPQDNVEETRSFIVSWLAETCSYNLQVGSFPEDRDSIEYFLFERQEGYCQHFASAAVMMFRMYGVPARYATGLAVSESLFHEAEQGTVYTAQPTDRCAHAWVEIYQEEYGWIPVEVTPAGAVDGVSPAQQEILLTDPATENQPDQGEQAEATPAPETTESPETQTEQPEEQENSGTETGDGANDTDGTAGTPFWESQGFQTFLAAARRVAAGAGIFVLICLALWVRRAVLLAGRKKKDAAGIFEDLLTVLGKIGLPADSDWLEDDFAQKVCRRFSWMEEDEFQAALDLALESTYGKKRASKRERRAVRQLYLKCCREAVRKMGRWEKFRFRVWDAYY